MTRTVWSINGLAVELQKQRRDIAEALSGVDPDGTTHGTDGWFLTTALKALGGSGKIDGEYERARKDRELADRTALQNAVTRGTLISAEDAEAAWTAMQANARERLLAMPAKLSDRCAISSSPSEIYGLIEDEVHTALDELADAAVYAAEPDSPEADDDAS